MDLQELLAEAAKRKASDLHLKTGIRARSCGSMATSRCRTTFP